MASPTLPPAVILETSGWEQTVPTRGSFVVEFEEHGDGWIVIAQANNGKMAYRFQPAFLTLAVRNGVIQSGGGLVGTGLGVEGASQRMVGDGLLSRLTTQHPRSGVLIFSSAQPGVAAQTVVLGYENIPDEEVAARIAEVIPAYMDYWGGALVDRLRNADDAQRRETAPAVDTMASRGWFTVEQLDRLEACLRPRAAIDAMAREQEARSPPPTPPQVPRDVPDSADQSDGSADGNAGSSPKDPDSLVAATAGNQQSQMEGVKTCPMCAEEVKAAALVCRFCGYQFKDHLPIPPRPDGPPPKALRSLLAPDEALFVWSPGYLNGGDGIVAITSDRVVFLMEAVPTSSIRSTAIARRPSERGR